MLECYKPKVAVITSPDLLVSVEGTKSDHILRQKPFGFEGSSSIAIGVKISHSREEIPDA
jgi:hypothetical protein